MIELDLVEKRYGARVVLGPMRLSVARGEALGIYGPSGAGKSSLLRILAGLERAFRGDLRVQGRRAMVFQAPVLLPWRSVAQNIMLPTGASAQETEQILARVGLAGRGGDWPAQLSLGQARRVALARAFVRAPEILLMDEPFTSLDPDRVADLLALTGELIAQHRPAVILVSHVAAELSALGCRARELSGSPARLAQ